MKAEVFVRPLIIDLSDESERSRKLFSSISNLFVKDSVQRSESLWSRREGGEGG